MARVLVLFASEEGQTAKIARRIADQLRDRGMEVALRDSSTPDPAAHLAGYDGVVIGSAIHYGHHAKQIRDLVRNHRAILNTRHTAFFSVSLSAGGPHRDAAASKRYLEEFSAESGWKPDLSATFAGALRHSHYGILKTLLVRLSLRKSGPPQAGDHEYTDWNAVSRFVDAFATRLAAPGRGT